MELSLIDPLISLSCRESHANNFQWADETAQSKKNLAKSHENNDEHALEEKVKLFFEWVDRQDFSKVPMEDKVHCGGRKMRGRR